MDLNLPHIHYIHYLSPQLRREKGGEIPLLLVSKRIFPPLCFSEIFPKVKFLTLKVSLISPQD